MIAANGASIDIGSAQGLGFDTLVSPGTVAIVAGGDLRFNAIDAGANLLLSSTGGLVVGNLDTGGRVSAIGGDIAIQSTGALDFDVARATAGDVNVRTAGDLDAALVSASNAVSLASSAGGIHATGSVSGATVSLSASSDVVADADLTSSGALNVDAGGAFALGGTASGTTIAAHSGDIRLASGAQLGARGTTQDIVLTNGLLQNGTPVTGLDTAALVTINGRPATAAGQFGTLSTINACAIGADCNPADVIGLPADDDLVPPVTAGDPADGALSSPLIQLEENQPLISPPLVDEPITGVGNDDLWVAQCTKPQQEACPQQDQTK